MGAGGFDGTGKAVVDVAVDVVVPATVAVHVAQPIWAAGDAIPGDANNPGVTVVVNPEAR